MLGATSIVACSSGADKGAGNANGTGATSATAGGGSVGNAAWPAYNNDPASTR